MQVNEVYLLYLISKYYISVNDIETYAIFEKEYLCRFYINGNQTRHKYDAEVL